MFVFRFLTKRDLRHAGLMVIGGIGGWLLSSTGLPAGWMIGAMFVSAALTFWKPDWFHVDQKGIRPFWRQAGQWLLAIEMGHQVNRSIWLTLFKHGPIIFSVLLVSIGMSLLCGWALWRYSRTDLLTGLFASTPGGISAMPNLAEEVGANPIVVSVVQLIRLSMVVGAIPLLAFEYVGHPSSHAVISHAGNGSPLVTVLLACAAWIGAIAGKRLKFPAPWLVGGILGAAIAQTTVSVWIGHDVLPWWTDAFFFTAQVLIGTSIGSKVNREQLREAKSAALVGSITSLILVLVMVFCAVVISKWTNIPLTTSLFAMAPGGIAEMAMTSVSFHANATFVVTVQILRFLKVMVMLPPLLRLVYRKTVNPQADRQKVTHQEKKVS
jgi:membrane AbrB-like protein